MEGIRSRAIDAIRHSYAVLSTEQNLSPENERITESLTHLVRSLAAHSATPGLAEFLLTTPQLEIERLHLPQLCGLAECEMEKFWARRLLDDKNVRFDQFWYFAEYRELCAAETHLFQGRTYSHISFLGSGALPLTAFLLAKEFPDARITCVDIDPEACDLSARLAAKAGLAKNVHIACMDALEYKPAENELVICASLLEGREQVYERLKNRKCSLLVRDAEGVYQFLYKPAVLPKEGFRKVSKTSVDPKRINTTHFFERDVRTARKQRQLKA